MTTGEAHPSLLTWAVAGAPLELGTESGDCQVVAPFDNGTLVAVIDGLGHGPEAAVAAQTAREVLQAHAGESVVNLVHRCHEELRKSRGAVMSIASFDGRQQTLSWLGVGNVEGLLLRGRQTRLANEAIVARGGVVGYQLPPLRPTTLSVAPGDTLIMTTDGIRSGYSDGLDLSWHPEATAQFIFDRYARGSDDALVLVARYEGGAP